jgi:hypothetical protein
VSEETAEVEVGSPGTIEVPSETVERKPTKIEEKRRKIYIDRMQRHMAKGLTVEQAHMKIQEEDYERLPIEAKLKRLEMACMQAIQRLAGELGSLQNNDQVIADAMDSNFRAITKALVKLGVTGEEQVAFLKEAEEEIKKDRENQQKVREAHAAAVQEEATKAQVEKTINQPGEASIPDGATEFA